MAERISKFFSRQRLASISLGFRVIKISSLGVFNKKRGFYMEGFLTVKNKCGFLTGGDGVGSSGLFKVYLQVTAFQIPSKGMF